MKKGLLALACGGMAIGMAEFTMMGILPIISQDLGVSIPSAASLITLYALGVVVGAPTLVLISGKYPPKKILMILMVIFVVFHALFAISPSFTLLKITRFVAGLPHGAFFGVGSVVATRLAKKGKEAQAIAIMFTGLTLANLVGVPLGTFVGEHLSWRVSYGIISFIGLITLIAIGGWLPNLPQQANNNLRKQLHYFKKRRSWLLVAVIAIGTGGLFAWVSYIAPLVINVSGLAKSQVPIIMILVGLGMVIGNLLGGKLADIMNPTIAAIIGFLAMVICLLVVHFTASIGFMAYVMALITGIIAFLVGTPLQMMLIRDAKGAETFAASAGQACFNMGNTLGAYLGGIPITLGLAYDTPVLVGCGLALVGAFLAFAFLKSKKPETPIATETE